MSGGMVLRFSRAINRGGSRSSSLVYPETAWILAALRRVVVVLTIVVAWSSS